MSVCRRNSCIYDPCFMTRLPESFLNEIHSLLGNEEFEAYLKCFDEPRLYGLRVNTAKISADDSRVQVWVIPTDEELAIARDTLELATK